MDLSDGSDAGEELDYDLDENDILGGSDDEERANAVGCDDEDQHGETEQYEDADYLDLATTGEFKDELNPANDSSTEKVAPVKVRNITSEPAQPTVPSESEDTAADDEETTDDRPYHSSTDASHLLDDDEDADEEKSERSRFHNERQLTQPHHSGSTTGSPIRSLGAKSTPHGHGMRGNGQYAGPRGYRGQGQYPRHFMRDRPFMNQRLGLMRPPYPPYFMNRMRGPPDGPPIYQFQEGILTDFNDPPMMKQMPHLVPPRHVHVRPNRFQPMPYRQPFIRQNNPNANTNLKQVGLPPPNQSNSNQAEVAPNPSVAGNQTHQAETINPVYPGPAPVQISGDVKSKSGSGLMSNSKEVPGFSKDDSRTAVIIPQSEALPRRSNEALIYTFNKSPPKQHVQRPRFQNIPTRCPVRPSLTIVTRPPFPHQFQGPQAQQVQFCDPNSNNQNFIPNQAQFMTPTPALPPNWALPQPQQMPGAPPMNMPFNPPFQPQMQNPEFMPQQPQHMNMPQSQPMNNFMPPNQFYQRTPAPYMEPQYNHPGPAPVAAAPYANANPFEFQERQQPHPSHYLSQQQASYQDSHMFQPTVYHYQPRQQPPSRSDEDMHREIFRRDERDERSPLKRIYDERDEFSRESRKPRLQDRLGPPPKPQPEPKHHREEIEKLIEETKKELGLGEDDEYLRKIEEQKRKREEILRQKEARRKGVLKESSSTLTQKSEPKPRAAPSAGVPAKHSVYLNPKTFNGDLLSALDDKLKKINMSIVPSSISKNKVYIRNQAGDNESVKEKPSSTIASSGSGPKDESKPPVRKGKTILRVVRNKKGEIISKSKVVVMKSQHVSK